MVVSGAAAGIVLPAALMVSSCIPTQNNESIVTVRTILLPIVAAISLKTAILVSRSTSAPPWLAYERQEVLFVAMIFFVLILGLATIHNRLCTASRDKSTMNKPYSHRDRYAREHDHL